jgi:hypothetical protein
MKLAPGSPSTPPRAATALAAARRTYDAVIGRLLGSQLSTAQAARLSKLLGRTLGE